MENLDKLLRKVEKNYSDKEKRETSTLTIKDSNYEVVTLTRSEKSDLFFSQTKELKTMKDIYKWLQPFIYKSLQLKPLALKAKEMGYINSYYEIIDMLFEVDEIAQIVKHIFKINNLENYKNEVLDFQKKQ